MKIYVCSPLKAYNNNTSHSNIEKAKKYCRFVAMETGNTPIAPHIFFTNFLEDDIQDERELGIKMGLGLLRTCSEVWVFGDYISDGMAKEIELAFKRKMTVKFYTEDCKRRNENETKKTKNQL